MMVYGNASDVCYSLAIILLTAFSQSVVKQMNMFIAK